MMTLTTLFLDELADQYDAEKRQVMAMPGMLKAATCTLLQKLLRAHLKETESHVKTLEKVFGSFGERPRAKQCEATIARLKEGDEITAGNQGAQAIDACLISVAQRIESCEITSYACLRNQAALLENREAADILNGILVEEEAAHQAFIALGVPALASRRASRAMRQIPAALALTPKWLTGNGWACTC